MYSSTNYEHGKANIKKPRTRDLSLFISSISNPEIYISLDPTPENFDFYTRIT